MLGWMVGSKSAWHENSDGWLGLQAKPVEMLDGCVLGFGFASPT